MIENIYDNRFIEHEIFWRKKLIYCTRLWMICFLLMLYCVSEAGKLKPLGAQDS